VLIAALASAPGDLKRVARRTRQSNGGHDSWSLVDILNHLVHVELAARARLERVREEDRPRIANILPDESQHDREKPVEDLLAAFDQARVETIVWLKSLPPGDWQRKATFEDGRVVNLRRLVQMLVEHDTEHLSQAILLRDG
jgi:uncharacterized damage-inducible protein DinB